MQNEHSCCSPLSGFIRRMLALVELVIFVAGILFVFFGVFFSRKKFNEADDPVESSYWYVRYWSFLVGAYAIMLFMLVVLYVNGGGIFYFMAYWPAFSMLWVDDSWFGSSGHEFALMIEPFFMVFISFLLALVARLYGTYDWELESFDASNLATRQWIDTQLEDVRAQMSAQHPLHPANAPGFNDYTKTKQEALIAEWLGAKEKQIEELLSRRSYCG